MHYEVLLSLYQAQKAKLSQGKAEESIYNAMGW